MRPIQRGDLRAPSLVVDLQTERVDRAARLDVSGAASLFCVVRSDGRPTALHFVDVEHDTDVELGALLDEAVTAAELRPATPGPDLYADLRSIDLTVAICTRDRQAGLRILLQSLLAQTDRDFEVVVVDNSASGSLVQEFTPVAGLDVRVVHEPVPGLSHARNTALAEVRTSHVAWIDDDERADPDWILWIKRGFVSEAGPGVVSGLMLPAELETQAQVDFERYGGFNKGRGIQQVALIAGTPSVPNTIYPLPNFGAGGNMAFETDLLRRVGGFEPRLGAGTLTHGGEETLALSQALEDGATILHWPPSITWHYHRRTPEALQKQFYGYAAGLSAFYMALLLRSPVYLLRILLLVPRGLADLLVRDRADDRSDDNLPDDFPSELLAASRRGLLAGAFLYLRERVRQRRQLGRRERVGARSR